MPTRYIVDNGEGDAAVIHFGETGCLGVAISDGLPSMSGDEVKASTDALPRGVRDEILALLELPFVRSYSGPLATFWTQDGIVTGARPWHQLYADGGEILRLELCSDEEWIAEVGSEYGFDIATARGIISIADRRRSPNDVVFIRSEEERFLVPEDSSHRDEALEQLLHAGVYQRAEAGAAL